MTDRIGIVDLFHVGHSYMISLDIRAVVGVRSWIEETEDDLFYSLAVL